MKGQGEIVAIILVLMIVVSLVALAYVWFTGVFGILTKTTEEAVTQTAGAMTTKFIIENAICNTGCGGLGYDCIHVSVRNTGAQTINGDNIAAYVDNSIVNDNAAGDIVGQDIQTFDVGTASGEVDCTTASTIKITIGTGLTEIAKIK
jgi:flagellin-like protein